MPEKNDYLFFRENAEKTFPDAGDRKRLLLEFELIEKKRWEKYAVALSRILRGVRRNLPNAVISGTAAELKIFGGKGGGSVIEKPLHASFSVVWPFSEMLQKDLEKILRIIPRNLRGLGLHTQKGVLQEDFTGKKIVVVISKEDLGREAFIMICDALKAGENDSAALIEYLVLTIDASIGLSVNLGNFL